VRRNRQRPRVTGPRSCAANDSARKTTCGGLTAGSPRAHRGLTAGSAGRRRSH
jgi:hypothetical protein